MPNHEEQGNPIKSKVKAAGLSGAIVAIVIFAAERLTEVSLPPDVAAAVVTIVAFVAAYVRRETVAAR